jgi:hypothetical protein
MFQDKAGWRSGSVKSAAVREYLSEEEEETGKKEG